jgi:uncharacterized protein
MQMNVSGLLKSSIGATRDYEIDDIVDIAGCESPVRGTLSMVRTNRGILVKATLNTEVEVNCSRCLNPFRAPLILVIEEEYFPLIDVESGTSMSIPDEPGCFTIDEQHILDMTEAVRQYALMATPMKPLCRGNCAGLCPSCGHNLNKGPCNCPPGGPDRRWSKLSRIFKQ